MFEDRLEKYFKSLYERMLRKFSMLALAVVAVVTSYLYGLLLVAWPWDIPSSLAMVNFIALGTIMIACSICGVIAHGLRDEIRNIAAAIRNNGESQNDVEIPHYRCNDLDVLVEEVKQLLAANKELRVPLDEIRQKCAIQSNFLRGLGEQLIAPTHLILNNIELASHADMLPAAVEEQLQMAQKSAADLMKLVQSVKAMAALDQANDLEFGKRSITSCMERAIEIMRPPFFFMRLWLEARNNATKKELYCDAGLIVQMLVSLLSHSAAGNEKGGKVGLTIRDHTIAIGNQNYDAILIEVADQGKPLILTSVFSIFEAVDQEALKKSPYRAPHKADLAIAANITELHYGRIWAVPRSDGCLIRVAIPRDFREITNYINNMELEEDKYAA